MEKQIDEMAKALCHTETCEIKKIGIPCNHRCKAHIYATRAIKKCYRKQSEVAREIFEEIEKLTYRYLNDDCYSGGDIIYDLSELKKKYTEVQK